MNDFCNLEIQRDEFITLRAFCLKTSYFSRIFSPVKHFYVLQIFAEK